MNRLCIAGALIALVAALFCFIDSKNKMSNLYRGNEQKALAIQKELASVREARSVEMDAVRHEIEARNSKKVSELRKRKEAELIEFEVSLSNRYNRAAADRKTREIMSAVITGNLTDSCSKLGLQKFMANSEMFVNSTALKSFSVDNASDKVLLKYENTSTERQKPAFKITFYDRHLQPCASIEKKNWNWAMKKIKNWRHPTQYGGLEPNEKYEEAKTVHWRKGLIPQYYRVEYGAVGTADSNRSHVN